MRRTDVVTIATFAAALAAASPIAAGAQLPTTYVPRTVQQRAQQSGIGDWIRNGQGRVYTPGGQVGTGRVVNGAVINRQQCVRQVDRTGRVYTTCPTTSRARQAQIDRERQIERERELARIREERIDRDRELQVQREIARRRALEQQRELQRERELERQRELARERDIRGDGDHDEDDGFFNNAGRGRGNNGEHGHGDHGDHGDHGEHRGRGRGHGHGRGND